jgi:hypothetical protein
MMMNDIKEIKINEKELSNFDKLIMDDKDNEKYTALVHPLIFVEKDNECFASSRPIFTGAPIDMMCDSNLELIDKKEPMQKVFDDNQLKYDIYGELFFDQRFTVIESLKNMIIESSSLTFNNYWRYVCSSIINIPEYYCLICINKFIKHLRENTQELYRFLGGFATTVEEVHLTYKDAMLEKKVYTPLFSYIDQKAIIMSQYISGLMGQTIHEFLFDYLVNNNDNTFIQGLIDNGSVIANQLMNNNRSDTNSFLYSLITQAIYPSFYNLTMTCISPSIGNILSSGVNSLFTLYNDVKYESMRLSKDN